MICILPYTILYEWYIYNACILLEIFVFLSYFIKIFLGDRDKFCLPEDVTIVHAEFTYYYYPGDITFPCK